jgi:hypothetical protein
LFLPLAYQRLLDPLATQGIGEFDHCLRLLDETNERADDDNDDDVRDVDDVF